MREKIKKGERWVVDLDRLFGGATLTTKPRFGRGARDYNEQKAAHTHGG